MLIVQRFKANRRGRDYVVGDVHGQLELLGEALRRVRFDRRVDRLFSVGDLVDRGPASALCLALVAQPWCHAVRGNHEELMIDALADPQSASMAVWLYNGGGWALAETLAERRRVVALAQGLPLAMEVALPDGRRVGITHARPPCADWADTERALQHSAELRRFCLWDRGLADPSFKGTLGIDLTVHGHSIVAKPVRRRNAAQIDVGAGLFRPGTRIDWANAPPLAVMRLEDLFALADTAVSHSTSPG